MKRLQKEQDVLNKLKAKSALTKFLTAERN